MSLSEAIGKALNKVVDVVRRLDEIAKDENGQPLPCYGCANSAAYIEFADGTVSDGTEFPGMPSGERPCCFCVRNPKREEWLKEEQQAGRTPAPDAKDGKNYDPFTGHWYNGAPALRVPMDCYQSLDMQEQTSTWLRKSKPYSGLSPAETERLALLLEEMGEAHQIVGKILRHGYESRHPDGGPTNRGLLEEEAGHVTAAMIMLQSKGDISGINRKAHESEKLEKARKYLHHQEESK